VARRYGFKKFSGNFYIERKDNEISEKYERIGIFG
jgi:hypothetical protein